MRAKKALINTIASISYEVVALACGLILPRLILSYFGSSYNGITSSISQFISCISLMKAGLVGVTRYALYKPLAEHDTEQISSVVNTTQSFMRRIALIFLIVLFFFAIVYPSFVSNEFDWLFSSTLVIIIGVSTFSQYYFGLTYGVLLEADQKKYVSVFYQIGCTILYTLFASLLIIIGFGIHAVKLVSAVAFTIYPLLMATYAKKHYHLNPHAHKDNNLISQRWDAFAQEVAFFVHNNTAVILLTLFTDLKIVSVYAVYNYVTSNLFKVIQSFISGFSGAFGNMLAKREYAVLQENTKIYEVLIFSLSAVFYSTCLVLIVPFALLYTHGVNDISYSRPIFAGLISMAGMFSCFRIPYKTIVDAAGHFKQMRNGALLEAALNLFISLSLIGRFGLVGVATGMLVATIFRSTQYALYMMKVIIPMNFMHYVGHVLVNLLTAFLTFLAVMPFHSLIASSLGLWIIGGVGCVCLTSILTINFNLLFYKKEFVLCLKKIKHAKKNDHELQKTIFLHKATTQESI